MKRHILNQTETTRTVVMAYRNVFIISYESKKRFLWFSFWRVDRYIYSTDLKELNYDKER